ncbi:MAG TPA: hypothetical protein VK550_01800 [Polyangiaceae bacterium]|jgi:hypothetical protein|nr:hypothetical protein [Polyangiaceae bacterium]
MTSTAHRGAQGQSFRSLVTLLRRTLGRSWGIRAARFYAALLSLGVVTAIAISAGGLGANDTSLSLVARSAAMLVWVPGAMCALALAKPPHDASLAQGIAVLAGAHGFDGARFARAEALATVRLLGEVILVPLLFMGVFVFAILARGGLASMARPLAGSIVFGSVAAMVLGSMASVCRRWGGARGRTWLAGAVFGPWLFAEMALSGRVATYVSIPGLLGRLWEALAAVPT